jgi:hypothetical protein
MRFIWVALVSLLPISAFGAPTIAARTTSVTIDAATMKVTQTVRGSCWTGSIASRRHDAYRCSVVNSIHDPCFRIDSKNVACPTNVAANSGVRIALTKPLPVPNGTNARNPFVMQLAGGITCNVGTGTVVPDYPFYCTGDLVCAAPTSIANRSAVFVACGKAKNGLTVTGIGKYLVRVMYE